MSLKGSEHSQENACVAESVLDKIAGLQDCCKTYLLHAHLRFYFSFPLFFINFVFLKSVRCKFMFMFIQKPSRASTMDFFAKIVNGLYKTTSCARRPLLSAPKSGSPINV